MSTARRCPARADRRGAGRVTPYGSAALVCLVVAQVFNFPNLSTNREARVDVVIAATAEQVWRLLTDLSSYAVWNPYIYPASGEIRVGAPLDMTLHSGSQVRTTRVTVLSVKPGEELSWGGHLMGKGFDEVLTFTIQPLEPGKVQLTAVERFRGILLPLVGGLPDEAQAGLEEMLHALRSAAELESPITPRRHGGVAAAAR